MNRNLLKEQSAARLSIKKQEKGKRNLLKEQNAARLSIKGYVGRMIEHG